MTKEELKALGLTDEQVTSVYDDQSKNFVSKGKFNETNEAKKALESQITERDTQLKDLKKQTGDNAELKAQIEKLQSDNKQKDDDYQKQIADMRIDTAVRTALTGAKAKNVDAVKALLKMEKYEMDGDKVKGLDDAIAAAKKDNSWAFEAEATNPSTTVQGGFKPAEGSDNAGGGEGSGNSLQDAFDKAVSGEF